MMRLLLFLPLEAKQSVDLYEQNGKEELRRHFEQLRKVGLMEPYFFTGDGNEVLGSSPSSELRAIVAATNTAPVLTKLNSRNSVISQRTTGRSGRYYIVLLVVPSPSLGATFKGLGFKTVLGALAVLIVGGTFCFFLTRHIARPVVQVSNTAGQIADGWLGARTEPSIRLRRDEIGRLAASFDRMAERIESLVHGQQRLFADVSHELRSPLARLSVAEGLLRQCPSEERQEYIDRIELEVEHLDRLIGQLLAFARVDGGADSSRKEAVELTGLIQEVAADCNFEAQHKGCAVTVESGDPLTIGGAREQLRRAIENIVRNAIRYSQPGMEVKIRVEKRAVSSGSKAVVQVRDHGPGVPNEHLEKIFFPFHRVSGPNEETTGGAGLGLAITERIALMYGGSVTARNAEGGGLIVEMEFPVIT
jgi:signal transduction histidine kinase